MTSLAARGGVRKNQLVGFGYWEALAVEPTHPSGHQGTPSFASAFAIDLAPDDDRSTEDWARQLWEGAPVLLRAFMVFGWRGVLRLRLAAERSPDRILGWSIDERRPDRTVCRAESRFLTAYNSFERRDGRFVWSTHVFYERPAAGLLWPPAALLHRPIARMSLARAQRKR